MASVPASGGNAAPAQTQGAKKVDGTGEASASLTPELVIALCGPIGSPLHEVAEQFQAALQSYKYTTESIRLSRLIEINADKVGAEIDKSNRFTEVSTLIDAGDKLRERYGSDVLAKLAVARIGGDRDKMFGAFRDAASDLHTNARRKIADQRVCHIVDSIKNKSELDLLRLLYGEALFAIGVFSPLEVRRANLERPGSFTSEQISKLIDVDSGEEFSHGQSVRDTFPLCDFFLRVDHACTGATLAPAIGQITNKLTRLLGLMFRTSIVTPTLEEAAMYAAASAARNSACLSRQVGAAVTGANGEVLAVGWNDVPQSGGGVYGKPALAPGLITTSDQRCYNLTGQRCHNDLEKAIIAEKVVDVLIEKQIVARETKAGAIRAISGDSRVKDLIEFSRAVHAEMHAILGASRVAGDRVLGGKIFITTYPCHGCARHIVAAGISEIHYIEPYRKSLATKLHSDSLSECLTDTGKVILYQFDGLAPRRFIDMFQAGDRKSVGVLKLPKAPSAKPVTQVRMRAIPHLEAAVVAEVKTKELVLMDLADSEEE